ncbi:MAG: hypothetical protein ACI8P9_002756 [Parasphingorhabdus sp.]|jgi:hypothetical protein
MIISLEALWLFLPVALAINLSPGPSVMLVTSIAMANRITSVRDYRTRRCIPADSKFGYGVCNNERFCLLWLCTTGGSRSKITANYSAKCARDLVARNYPIGIKCIIVERCVIQ